MRTMADNWKTSLAGIALIASGLAMILKVITMNEFLLAFTTITGGGFLAAQDGGRRRITRTRP